MKVVIFSILKSDSPLQIAKNYREAFDHFTNTLVAEIGQIESRDCFGTSTDGVIFVASWHITFKEAHELFNVGDYFICDVVWEATTFENIKKKIERYVISIGDEE